MKKLTTVISATLLLVFSLDGQVKTPDWVKVTDHAGWKARDSQGEAVFKDQLWIMGGWFNSYEAPPRDVWSSKDGKNWKPVNGFCAMDTQRPGNVSCLQRENVDYGWLVQWAT